MRAHKRAYKQTHMQIHTHVLCTYDHTSILQKFSDTYLTSTNKCTHTHTHTHKRARIHTLTITFSLYLSLSHTHTLSLNHTEHFTEVLRHVGRVFHGQHLAVKEDVAVDERGDARQTRNARQHVLEAISPVLPVYISQHTLVNIH